jgi:hypothetical protein
MIIANKSFVGRAVALVPMLYRQVTALRCSAKQPSPGWLSPTGHVF